MRWSSIESNPRLSNRHLSFNSLPSFIATAIVPASSSSAHPSRHPICIRVIASLDILHPTTHPCPTIPLAELIDILHPASSSRTILRYTSPAELLLRLAVLVAVARMVVRASLTLESVLTIRVTASSIHPSIHLSIPILSHPSTYPSDHWLHLIGSYTTKRSADLTLT